jgi:hypothetical protein
VGVSGVVATQNEPGGSHEPDRNARPHGPERPRAKKRGCDPHGPLAAT